MEDCSIPTHMYWTISNLTWQDEQGASRQAFKLFDGNLGLMPLFPSVGYTPPGVPPTVQAWFWDITPAGQIKDTKNSTARDDIPIQRANPRFLASR